MRKFSLSALAAAGLLVGGLTASSASAADLGGNCCADLEERIAELEATTARKGNRKVSLTISGWVAEQVMWWDDGEEQNVYVGGLGTTLNSNVKFTGQATVMPGWYAGYVIHLEVYGSETLGGTNQDVATGPDFYNVTSTFDDIPRNRVFRAVNTLQSFWFIKSDHLGKVGIGLQSQASDNTAILPDGSGSLVVANFVQFDYAGFFVRGTDGSFGPTWGSLSGCTDCNGIPLNSVRYDSPTYHGFSVSASWGEDDFWDVAARYAGEWYGFKVAVAAAYSESVDAADTDSAGPFTFPNPVPDGAFVQQDNTQFFQIGAYFEHIPSGLWVYGAYTDLDKLRGPGPDDLNDAWYIKAGLRQRWSPLGHTVIYGEYERFNNDALFAAPLFSGATCTTPIGPDPFGNPQCEAEVDLWGVGIVQEIDAAAMSIWLAYRHLDADIKDVKGPVQGTVPTDDFDYIKFGGLINF